MKFQLISDVHGRFEHVEWDSSADLVLCAGDVSEFVKKGHRFLMGAPAPVLFIPGNHEFYNGDYFERIEMMKEMCEKSNGKITYLDNNVAYIDGYRIIGSTFWTDYYNLDPLLVTSSDYKMGDYNYIKAKNFTKEFTNFNKVYAKYIASLKENINNIHIRNNINLKQKELLKNIDMYLEQDIDVLVNNYPYLYQQDFLNNNFNPIFSTLINEKSKEFLENELNEQFNGKTIVMTHHAPTPTALSFSRFAVNPYGLNMNSIWKRMIAPYKIGAYANRLDEFVKPYQIDAWVHGHLHDRMCYRMGRAVVYCNATGNNSNNQEKVGFKRFTFEINEKNKMIGLLNMVKQSIFVTSKINIFLKNALNDNEMLEKLKNINFLKGVNDEIEVFIHAFQQIPETEKLFHKFNSFDEILILNNLTDTQTCFNLEITSLIIHKLRTQNINMLNILNKLYQKLEKDFK